MQCLRIDLMHKNWVVEKVWSSVTCLADDPRNLETRSNRRRTPGILSQTNKQAYNKYSSNAQVKLEQKIQPECLTYNSGLQKESNQIKQRKSNGERK